MRSPSYEATPPLVPIQSVPSVPSIVTRAVALGKLGVLSGVKEFPMRVKCATLGWHTLLAALGSGGTVSTE